MREHGHPDCWEVATYGDDESVTVECTRCGEVLVELIHPEAEEAVDKPFHPSDPPPADWDGKEPLS